MKEFKSLNFHNTFQAELSSIAEILNLANKGFIGTKEEIMNQTGITTGEKSGKIVPNIRYAEYMGLLKSNLKNGKYSFILTDFGKVVVKEDRYLMDDVTKLMLHYYITDKIIGAELWYQLFKLQNIQLDYSINKKLINEKAKIYYEARKVEFSQVFSSYKNENCFGNLNLLEVDKDTITFKSNTINFNLISVYAFILLDSWERYFNERNELTIDEIIEVLEIDKIFGFNREELLDMFEELELDGAINLNRQLTPIIIKKLKASDSYLSRLYENAM